MPSGGVLGSVATGAQVGTMVGGPVGTAIGAGIGLLGAGLSFMGASSKRREAQDQMQLLERQQYGIGQALRGLEENVGMKTELAEDVYGTGMDKAMFQTGQSLYGLTRQGMGAAAKT